MHGFTRGEISSILLGEQAVQIGIAIPLLVRRKLDRLDLIGVLKTRE